MEGRSDGAVEAMNGCMGLDYGSSSLDRWLALWDLELDYLREAEAEARWVHYNCWVGNMNAELGEAVGVADSCIDVRRFHNSEEQQVVRGTT